MQRTLVGSIIKQWIVKTEGLVCAVVRSRVHKFVIALKLLVDMSSHQHVKLNNL
jgi:hypothetical protein